MPAVIFRPRCGYCGRLLAVMVLRPFVIDCSNCGVRNPWRGKPLDRSIRRCQHDRRPKTCRACQSEAAYKET